MEVTRLKVLIIRAGALGDTLMLIPAISQLRFKAEIIIVGRHPGIDYIKPYVNLCIDFERSGWHSLFVKGAYKEKDLSIPGVTHVAAFMSDQEGVVIENLSTSFPSASVQILSALPQSGEKEHVALYMAKSLEMIGLPIDPARAFSDSLKHPLLSQEVVKKRKKGIILQPGSGSEKKNYPPNMWFELINGLKAVLKDGAEEIILLLGPSEERLLSFFSGIMDEGAGRLIFSLGREDLISLLGRASLYIGHDSGITHLAAMLGTPVIALFRGSSIEQWAPLGPDVRIMKLERGERDFIEMIIEEVVKYI